LWGFGPMALDVINEVRGRGGCADAVMRQRLAKIYTEHVLLGLIRERTLVARVRGDQPGPEASVRKILADEHGQHVVGLARDLTGAAAMIADETGNGLSGPSWYYAFLFSPALTIGGGTGEVQRNIVGERALGLPHEPMVVTD
ncbi:MAG: acyl-CoA dehydrogenase family protein, partial [Ilumatobacteraceae bacterium]